MELGSDKSLFKPGTVRGLSADVVVGGYTVSAGYVGAYTSSWLALSPNSCKSSLLFLPPYTLAWMGNLKRTFSLEYRLPSSGIPLDHLTDYIANILALPCLFLFLYSLFLFSLYFECL